MNILIIEDELPARARLIQILRKLEDDIHIVGELGSAKEAVKWLVSNPPPDVAFVDIHLSDDHSFSVFQTCESQFPVVFTTAYDQYLLESFEYNSIDYILKPVTEAKVKRALHKIRRFETHFTQRKTAWSSESTSVQRIIARKGADFVALDLRNIAYFYTDHKIVFARDHSGRMLIVDRTLTELENLLKSYDFFRINRKFLAHATAIDKFRPDNGKILVHLTPPMAEQIHVSKETAPAFRVWIAQGRSAGTEGLIS